MQRTKVGQKVDSSISTETKAGFGEDISWILRQIVDKTWARTYLGHMMDICRTYTGHGQKLDKLWDTNIDMEHRFFHNLFCLSHWHKPQGNAAAFGRASLTVSSNMVAFGRLGPAGPKSTHMKLRGDLC